MRRLILMRHAQAARGSITGDDFDRSLTNAGREDAALLGRALAKAGEAPSRALVSSALRTRQTWTEVQAAFPDAEVEFLPALYHAGEDALSRIIHAFQDTDSLMVIAHNPGVHALAAQMMEQASAAPSLQARVEDGFPTSTALVFSFDEADRPAYDGLYLARDLGGGAGE